MVEAAGVEPASENTSSQITTCVASFQCRGRLRTEPSAPPANPDMSHGHASGRNVATSLLNDDQSRAVGALKLIAHRLLSGESVVCVRSYVVFPRVLRGAWASTRVPRSRTPVEARSPPRWFTRLTVPVYGTPIFDVTPHRKLPRAGTITSSRPGTYVDTHKMLIYTHHADQHRDRRRLDG